MKVSSGNYVVERGFSVIFIFILRLFVHVKEKGRCKNKLRKYYIYEKLINPFVAFSMTCFQVKRLLFLSGPFPPIKRIHVTYRI